MKTKLASALPAIIMAACAAVPLGAQSPTIPPSIGKVWPVGMRRGTATTITIEGRNLSDIQEVLFGIAGVKVKVLNISDLPEERPKDSLAAPVPQGKKQEAKLEITMPEDVEPAVHGFRVRTPLGTSNVAVLDVGSLPEVYEAEANDSQTAPQHVSLPATLVGTIKQPGDVETYQFVGKAAQEMVFQVVASEVGSGLRSLLILRDGAGKELARSGESERERDAVVTCKLPADGPYTISVTDSEQGGGTDHYYRLNAGVLPYVTDVFPLGVRAGASAEVPLKGANLGEIHAIRVQPPSSADGWTTIPVQIKTPWGAPLNKRLLSVGNEPEVMEREPNDSPAEAQAITPPVTINGHISNDRKGAPADEDYFRFSSRKGQRLTIEVAAARLGSPLDSVVEVLDADGHEIPRATIRCLIQTSMTLYDRDSKSMGYRLVSTTGFHDNDYVLAGEELNHIKLIPDQPDADIVLEGYEGERIAYLGSSPQVHTVNEPLYRAEILPPDAQFPPNGLPVFRLTYRNDDGGPGYGHDSRLEFVAPRDGDYLVHLKDVRNIGSPDFAYRLTIRETQPDFTLAFSPWNPNVPQGGRVPLRVTVNRRLGYEGPIEIKVKGLPRGVAARPATILAGEDSGVVILEAAQNAPPSTSADALQIEGRADIGGREVVRQADSGAPLRIASVIPPPDVVVTAEPAQLALEPGKTTTVTLHVERKKGFKGRVPCNVLNLPPGVTVVNFGLNGVLVPEGETSRTFTLRADDWVTAVEQPIYIVGEVESNSPTSHASAPLALRVLGKKEIASTASAP